MSYMVYRILCTVIQVLLGRWFLKKRKIGKASIK